ncbi:putative disease resistance protein RGA4 [Cinnamomum micranthum f. kanehirae]|uniref:Putative disease resistance protein RGA4 n=1 Tax=Cinnamomum micranthum f. kanehirae TaxID=337451 RepID=A0A3S3MLE3_9MAGN|nr:putative disease resistance protein RGA4 [Cinnamomum micranthum f. kanehirae]
MEQKQVNTMLGAGGNNPMVQARGDIKADTGGNINLGIQIITQENRKRKKRKRKKEDERENMALQVVTDTAISYTVQGAWDAVKSCLQIGVDLFRGAKDRLVKIEVSLGVINNFIVIAEGSPKMDHKLMKLLENLKDAAYDAQDLLEEYEIADRRPIEVSENSRPVRDTITNKVRKVATSVVYPVAFPIIMRKKLKEVSERLEAIKAEAQEFQLEKKVKSLQIEFKKQRETHSFVHKSLVFERDKEKEEIVNSLLSNQAGDHEHVSVISIVGIGGIGKTTLAKLAFDQESVRDHFKPKMWVCVSDNFDVTGLLKKIIKRAEEEEKKEKNIQHGTDDNKPLPSSVEELQRRLGETLSGKKFLLVLDDVWNEDPQKWDRLRDLLLCGGRGSRIVVTTRILKVAFIMSRVQPYILKPLSEDGCWSLFCQKAFLEAAAHPNLAPIGREIVKKCRGIPLAVVALGGLLRSERSQHKWEFVRDNEMWNLDDENENAILPALRLSYSHLKPHLKQCFAFCAIFPQDYEIEKELVIKLWMAHGFIPTKTGMELEDTGNDISDELVMRSFFQDVEEGDGFDRIRRTFRMHDLMHDLAHSVMENEHRVVLNGKSKDISPRIRHVSTNGLGILAATLPKAQMLRTYVMLERFAFQFPCDVGLFKCLRALDFMRQDKQEVEKSQLLTSLGNLQHLRYLNLSFTLIEMLPESLTSLCYLQTLILENCRELCELPKEISKLTNLRCLDITGCDKLTHMPPKMGQLSCLQELSNFIVGRTNEIACSGIEELQDLNLRGSLRIRLLKNITDAIDVPRDTLIKKPNLTSLDLLWEVNFRTSEEDTKREVLEQQVLQGLQPHRCMRKLKIFCPNVPSWMMDTTLTELVNITLSGCWRCNHLPPLGELPFLKVLGIYELKNVECIGKEFYGNEVSGGFPSLIKLEIVNMQKLKTWSGLEWKGERAFPRLVKLEISTCPMLTTMEFFPDIKDLNVDQGMMQSLKNLKSFESMHQQNCNQSFFADEDQIRSHSSLQDLNILYCDKLIFSGLGLRYLSSLERLRIWNNNEFAHAAHELSFLTSLQSMWLDGCHGLKSLPEGIGNLTSLRELIIHSCPEMVSFPRELQRLSALKELIIYECHPSLEIRCTKDTGEDWDKIQHIPSVKINGRDLIARD